MILLQNVISTIVHYLITKVPLGIQTVNSKGNAVKEYFTDPETNLIKIPAAESTDGDTGRIGVGTTLFSGVAVENKKGTPTKIGLQQTNSDFSNLPNGIQIYFGSNFVIHSTDTDFDQLKISTAVLGITPDISKPINIPKKQLTKNNKLLTLMSKNYGYGNRFYLSGQSFTFNLILSKVNQINLEVTADNQLAYYVSNNGDDKMMLQGTGSFTFRNSTKSIVAFFQLPIVKITAY